MSEIRALNYSLIAIEQLKGYATYIEEMGFKNDARVHRTLAKMLKAATKFILPNKGELLDMRMDDTVLDSMILPFPCIALEMQYQDEGELYLPEKIEGIGECAATKRIALCWESGETNVWFPDLNEFASQFPAGGVFITSIYGSEAKSYNGFMWHFIGGCRFVPHELYELPSDNGSVALRLKEMEDLIHKRDGGKETMEIPSTVLQMLDESIAHNQKVKKIETDDITAALMIDTGSEMSSLLQMCAVLNCANVEIESLAPSKMMNRIRRSNGKQELFEYKILTLSSERKARIDISKGGAHASPRQHLRRAHRRILPTKTILVRSAVVGNPEHGKIDKSYRVIGEKPLID